MRTLDTDYFTVAWTAFELGQYADAQTAIERIPPERRLQPDVLELRWRICAKQNRWGDCVDVARYMTLQNPADASGWVHLAESVEKIDGGTRQMAYDILVSAAARVREPMLFFALARYSAQFGGVEEAKEWLDEARATTRCDTAANQRFTVQHISD